MNDQQAESWRDWGDLPDAASIKRIGWPHGTVRQALLNALSILTWSTLGNDHVSRLTDCINLAEDAAGHEKPIEAVLQATAAELIARQVNAPDGHLEAHLTDSGWVIPDMPRDRYPVQVEHVLAVGALVTGQRLMSLLPEHEVMLRDLAQPGLDIPSVDVRQTLYRTELALGACKLAAEAMFVQGRVAMQVWTRANEAGQRSARAASAGRGNERVADQELTEFIVRWQALHGRERGARKAAAAHFDVTERAIGKRLQKIRNQQG